MPSTHPSHYTIISRLNLGYKIDRCICNPLINPKIQKIITHNVNQQQISFPYTDSESKPNMERRGILIPKTPNLIQICSNTKHRLTTKTITMYLCNIIHFKVLVILESN